MVIKIVALLSFGLIFHGSFIGKYKYTIHNVTIESEKIPESFDDFKIIQISDLHIGSFKNPKKIEKAIKLINNQNADIIVFTGDFVNTFADEIIEFKNELKKITVKKGKYSILGNHDYGEYHKWDSETEKIKNYKDLCQAEEDLGFILLKNESEIIKIKNDKIAIVGIEYLGSALDSSYGDINKALENLDSIDTKILLSHDPSIWEKQIKDKTDILLTLSGHTHGMQMGFEFGKFFRFSPSRIKYKQWAGLYEKNGQYLYVNRGLGFSKLPVRIGIWPEITVITLKSKLK